MYSKKVYINLKCVNTESVAGRSVHYLEFFAVLPACNFCKAANLGYFSALCK